MEPWQFHTSSERIPGIFQLRIFAARIRWKREGIRMGGTLCRNDYELPLAA